MTDKQTPKDAPAPAEVPAGPSTFASRRAEREAREAVDGPPPPPRHRATFRAGYNAENPLLVIRHVQQ